MPTVPLPGESLRPGGLPALSAPGVTPVTDARPVQIARLGQATQQSSLQIMEAAAEAEDRLHVAAVKEAQARAEVMIQDADQAYMSTVGKGATGKHRTEAWESLQKQVDSVGKDLEHDVQKRLFQQIATQRMLQTRARWGQHEINQTRVYEIGAGKAALEAKKQAARRASPEDLQKLLGSVQAEAQSLAQKQGGDKTQVDLAVQAATGEVHAGRVQDLLNMERVTEASNYLEGIPDSQIDPETKARLDRAVKRGGIKEDAARLAVDVREKLTTALHEKLQQEAIEEGFVGPVQGRELDGVELATQGALEIQRMWEAGEIDSVELRDAAIADISAMGKRQRAAELDDEDTTMKAAEQWLIDNPLATIEHLPAELFLKVRDLGLMDELNAFAVNDRRYSTNKELFSRLFIGPDGDGLFNMAPREFVVKMRRELAPRDFERAMTLYAQANKAPDFTPTSILTTDELIKESARRLDILSRGGKGADDKLQSERFFNYQEDVQTRVTTFELRAGRNATRDELKKLVAEAEQDLVWVDRSFIQGDVQMPIGAVLRENRDAAYVSAGQMSDAYDKFDSADPAPATIVDGEPVFSAQIKDSVETRLIQELRIEGVPITEAAIAMMWVLAGRPKNLEDMRFGSDKRIVSRVRQDLPSATFR